MCLGGSARGDALIPLGSLEMGPRILCMFASSGPKWSHREHQVTISQINKGHFCSSILKPDTELDINLSIEASNELF